MTRSAMPVVTFDAGRLRCLIGAEIPTEELAQRMPMLGGDLDGVEGDSITIEWFPDRPDLLPLEGTAKALRAFLDVAPGLAVPPVEKPRTRLVVDPSVAAVRPHAALCFVRGVPMDDGLVASLVQTQEKLTHGPGRKRRKIAIGVHDARDVQGPFTYRAVGGSEHPFVPLKGDSPMTPEQVLREHPKGLEYAHLVPGDAYPVFLDGKGEVLSMPPVINAQRTALTAETRDVLIDVTGTDLHVVRQTAALLAASLAMHGGTIEAVEVHDASGTWTCPDMTATERVLHCDDVRRLLGIDLDGDAAAACLRRMGHAAEAYGNQVLVQSPPWRFDLLHDVDWIEDVAIGHGFDAFPGTLPTQGTFGRALPGQDVEDRLRTALLGLGFQEAKTLTLTDAYREHGAWQGNVTPSRPSSTPPSAPPSDDGRDGRLHGAVLVANPVLEEQDRLRTRIVPGLLHVLSRNRHRSLPQRLWELGEVVVRNDEGKDATVAGAWANRFRVGIVETSARTGFADVKALVEAVLRDMGQEAGLEPAEEPGFIIGRQAHIVADGARIGHCGELHPDTLVAFGLGAATVAAELDVEAFL